MMTDIRRDSPLFTKKLTISVISSSPPSSSSFSQSRATAFTPSQNRRSSSREESQPNSSPSDHQDSLDSQILTQTQSLVLQVLPGTRQHSNGQQENFLHFEITNDVDLYFLYTLDIGEHDFHTLKREQHIVVDFNGFPAKFIGLIDLCYQYQKGLRDQKVSGTHLASHFITKLNLASGVLSIVEVNEFNHVSHLNLQFRPGTDEAIKAYLSSSLKFALESNSRLTYDHEKMMVDLSEQRQQIEEMATDLRLTRENTERDTQCLQARHEQALAQLQQAHLKSLSVAREQADTIQRELRENLHRDNKNYLERISDLEHQLSEMTTTKREVEFTLRKIRGDLEKTESECNFYKSSQAETSALLRSKDVELAAAERELAKVLSKKEALEMQIMDKEEILQKATSLRIASEESRQSALEQLELYKSGLNTAQEKLQTAVSEIGRGNEAIRQLQGDIQTCRGKLQSKNEVIRKQETLVQELRSRLANSAREESKLKDDVALSKQKHDLLERELASAQASIAEGADIIQKNQEVISHLNEMINSLQLGGVSSSILAGGGMGNWTSPSSKPKYDRQHFSYPTTDQDVVASGGKTGYSFSSPSQQEFGINTQQPEGSRYTTVNKVSPDSITHGFSEDKFSSMKFKDEHLAQHEQRLRHSSSLQRLSLSPQQTPSPSTYDRANKISSGPTLSGTDGGTSLKGYYDGVLDPKYLVPPSNNPQTKTHSPSTQYIPGITHSNRKKPAAYSWQLEDFGREGGE